MSRNTLVTASQIYEINHLWCPRVPPEAVPWASRNEMSCHAYGLLTPPATDKRHILAAKRGPGCSSLNGSPPKPRCCQCDTKYVSITTEVLRVPSEWGSCLNCQTPRVTAHFQWCFRTSSVWKKLQTWQFPLAHTNWHYLSLYHHMTEFMVDPKYLALIVQISLLLPQMCSSWLPQTKIQL